MKQKVTRPGDKILITLTAIFLIFGSFMIYNSTAVFAEGTFGEAYRLIFLHLSWVTLGLLSFWFFYRTDYKFLQKYVYPIFIAALIPMIILAFFGFLHQVGIVECSTTFMFSPCINGANRWFYINPSPLPSIPLIGVLGFQPAEFAKLALVIFLASMLSKNLKAGIGKKYAAFLMSVAVTGFVSFLLVMQPNFSNAALVFFIGMSMYFVSGASLVPLFASAPLGLILGIGFVISSAYRRARLMTFLNGSSEAELTMGYHIKQILIALGSGGLFGVGFGQSRQKFQYLPEVSADSIFAIIGEELGFVGTLFVVVLFGVFIYRGFYIAQKAPDMFGKLLAAGITSWIGFQFFINISAMTRIIPLTGMPLPLISYGGSSTIFILTAVGILTSISRQAEN